ncbi:MAG: response regulator [Planctomycetota bacterium]|nr:response regulator [Planctomycetota bacterium]
MNGYIVHTAENGAEALRVYESYKDEINLLISDVAMPQMGGATLAQQLIRLNPEIKVLFMSGYTNQGIVLGGTLEPGAHFLQKPFTPSSLAQKVREVLDGVRNE